MSITLTGSGQWEVPEGVTRANILLVGGGGGGGSTFALSYCGGGGGGGGVLLLEDYVLTPGELIDYAIGAGGAGGVTETGNAGATGGNTTFDGKTALGGGGGGGATPANGNGLAGGSGGGGGDPTLGQTGGAATQPGSTDGGLGNAGGLPTDADPSYAGGGGGGASAAGGNATVDQAGAGGAGFTFAGEVYGSGGGGGVWPPAAQASGGTNAGDGGRGIAPSGFAATDGFGGGGGGAGAQPGYGGAGGDGGNGTIIIVPTDEPFIPPEFPTRIYYAAVLRALNDSASVRLPISSWQATLQTDRQSYLQVVVPAAEQYIDQINAIGLLSTISIIRGAVLPDGSITELTMATVPLQQAPYQRGAQRSTVTLSGYGPISFTAVDPDAPPAGSVRTMTGVQTISIDTSGVRVRALIDWLLRPGMIAVADDSAFQAAYINYYATATQEFMDVGSRPL